MGYRMCDGDVEVPLVDGDRDDEVLAGDLFADELDRLRLDRGLRQGDERDPELEGERLRDLLLGGHLEGDDDFAQLRPPGALFGERPRQVFLVEEAGLD